MDAARSHKLEFLGIFSFDDFCDHFIFLSPLLNLFAHCFYDARLNKFNGFGSRAQKLLKTFCSYLWSQIAPQGMDMATWPRLGVENRVRRASYEVKSQQCAIVQSDMPVHRPGMIAPIFISPITFDLFHFLAKPALLFIFILLRVHLREIQVLEL